MFYEYRKALDTVYNYIYIMYIRTCSHGERCIADTIIWCSNPVVSSIGSCCISDSKISSQCIVIGRSGKMDIAALLVYQFCATSTHYDSIPLYIITA